MKGKDIINYTIRGEVPDLEQVRENCHREINNTAGAVVLKRSYIRRPALIATVSCILAALLLTTAFAYGEEIIAVLSQFMFGRSSIAQVDSVDGGNAAIGFEIVNRSQTTENGDFRYTSYVQFSSFDEANQVAPFDIKEPSYIPENAALNYIAVLQFKDKSYGYDVQASYTIEKTNGTGSFNLFLYYAGPGAYLNIETVEPIQVIMVGDTEASAIYTKDGTVHMYWIQDEIVYELFSTSYDTETLLKIAESIS